MFFRRKKPGTYTFAGRLEQARQAGFLVESVRGRTRLSRGGCAAEVSDAGGGHVSLDRAGALVGEDIGALVDIGFQKVWQTPLGKRVAAQADHLKNVHAFTEDLRESLGLASFYNQGLGSTNDVHLYDRVQDRDTGARHPWK